MSFWYYSRITSMVMACLVIWPQTVTSGQVSVINPASGSSVVVFVPQPSAPSPVIAPSVGSVTAFESPDIGKSLRSQGKDASTQNFINNFDLTTLTTLEINAAINTIQEILETKKLPKNKQEFLSREIAKLMELKAYRTN